jgi:hypothetical protein
MIRVQAILAYSGMQTPVPFDDERIFATCTRCGEAQALGDCDIRLEAEHTHYLCKNGCQDLVIVSPAGMASAPLPRGGYRFGGYVLRNAVDIQMWAAGNYIKFPASRCSGLR